VGPYLHKPCFPENFGATEVYDVASRRSLDDWVTFYSGTERLIRYLQRENCNSALIAALADGSTIYPSALLEPTPRYDTGVYSSAGHDPCEKTSELLYRMFDREGLVLIRNCSFRSARPSNKCLLKPGKRPRHRTDTRQAQLAQRGGAVDWPRTTTL
jgi:hypothetical protein